MVCCFTIKFIIFFIVGRSDDMIIIGSHNVYPEGVEDTILASHYVNDSIVFGVKDDIYGERPTINRFL